MNLVMSTVVELIDSLSRSRRRENERKKKNTSKREGRADRRTDRRRVAKNIYKYGIYIPIYSIEREREKQKLVGDRFKLYMRSLSRLLYYFAFFHSLFLFLSLVFSVFFPLLRDRESEL